jgi:curved DNA-binding protein CbpA
LERNHYRVLAVAPDATTEEIERSFRQLARRLHPDLNGGDGATLERMKELNVARTTLADPAARAAYDEGLRREQRAKAAAAAAARTPVPAPSPPPARSAPAPAANRPPASARPRTPWARPREAPRAPTIPSQEIPPWTSARRVVWLALLSLIGLAVVLGLIWLRESLDP